MAPEDDPRDDISEEEYWRGLEDVKSCSRCNAGMPPNRVNHLCEECFAEDSEDFDGEAEDE